VGLAVLSVRERVGLPSAATARFTTAVTVCLGHPQCIAKCGSILAFWLLELVPYIVKVVPKEAKVGTGASSCSDAKFVAKFLMG
jgi:hypothetical protein